MMCLLSFVPRPHALSDYRYHGVPLTVTPGTELDLVTAWYAYELVSCPVARDKAHRKVMPPHLRPHPGNERPTRILILILFTISLTETPDTEIHLIAVSDACQLVSWSNAKHGPHYVVRVHN